MKTIRKIRDQRIAYLNLDVALGGIFVDKVSRSQIEEAVVAVARPVKLMHAIERDVEILNGAPIGSSDRAVKFPNSLYLGEAADRSAIHCPSYPDWLMFGEWDR